VGADLAPGTLLAAYRSGVFPMPVHNVLGWFSPDPRAVLPADGVHVSRSLQRSRRRFEIRLDTAFAEVVAACGDPNRPGGWITPDMAGAYELMHALGWAHSVEVWSSDGHLAGGLFGIAIGGLFAAESKFHRDTDASKVAVVALAELVAAAGNGADRVIDVQWSSDHLATLGVVEISRSAYLRRLQRALELPSPFPEQAREER
jgi:leucyl/phenylalanyl-tRNA--protein transferase